MSVELLLEHRHPQGACYLARTVNGLLAGRSAADARWYPSPQALIDCMRPLAERGHHWAWNLCYFAEELA